MQLEWFRQHKMFVYWVLLPVVVISLCAYGGSRGGSFFGSSGQTVRYEMGKTDTTLSPSEVFNYRLKLSKFMKRGGAVNSGEVGEHLLTVALAKRAGFEVGTEEMRSMLRKLIKNQIEMREGKAPAKIDEDIYGKLLNNMQMTGPDFEETSNELMIGVKYQQFVRDFHVGDGELFADYCREKQVVRIRYMEFKSDRYLDKAPQPTEEKIKSFYNTNKDAKAEDIKNVLFTQPTLAAELVGFDTEKYLAALKPTEDELKAAYERQKPILYVDGPPAKPGDPPKFKPYESVKADVETKWRDDKKFQASGELGTIKNELTKAEAAWQAEQDKLPEVKRVPFKTDEWVAKKNLPYLTYWTTPEQTQEVYNKGKKEMKATDAEWVKEIFFFAHPPEHGMGGDPNKMKDLFKSMFDGWTQPNAIDPAKPEKGYVMARKIKYTESKLKAIEDAKPAIIERLKVLDAVDMANKDAQKAHDDWDQGKELPRIDDMLEVKSDAAGQYKNPIAKAYFTSPKVIGEVLTVANSEPEAPTPENPNPAPHKTFYVGFPVELQLPTAVTFEKDTTWDREQNRAQIAQSYAQYLGMTLQTQINGKVHFQRDVKETPLYDSAGRGDD